MHYVDPDACSGCGDCVEVCNAGAISIADGIASIDSSTCTSCGRCAEVCPAEAILVLEMIPEGALATRDRRMTEAAAHSFTQPAVPLAADMPSPRPDVSRERSRGALLERVFSGLVLLADLALDRDRARKERSPSTRGSRGAGKGAQKGRSGCPGGPQGGRNRRPGAGRGGRQDRCRARGYDRSR